MSDYLTRLAQRALGVTPAVRPVIAPLFVSTGAGVADLAAAEEEIAHADTAGPSENPEETLVARSWALAQSEAPVPQVSVASRYVELDPPAVEQRRSRVRSGDDKDDYYRTMPRLETPSVAAAPAAVAAGAGKVGPGEPSPRLATTAAVYSSRQVESATERRSSRERLSGRSRDDAGRVPVPVVPAPRTHERTHVGRPRLRDADDTRLLDQLRALRASAAPQRSVDGADSMPNIVKVTIGRIEVRAVHPPAPAPAPVRPREPVHPSVSLRDYLTKRQGERT
jgi:hypothetical protein